jgi:hypothetical protein
MAAHPSFNAVTLMQKSPIEVDNKNGNNNSTTVDSKAIPPGGYIYIASIQCNENQKSNSTARVVIVKNHFNGRARSSGLGGAASSDSSAICPSYPA